MRQALTWLQELGDADIEWVLASCEEVDVTATQVVVREGEPAEALFLVVAGALEVRAGAGGRRLAMLGPGDIVGEMSFLEKLPPSATVLAAENARLLRLPGAVVEARLRQDAVFAAAFFRSLAILLSHRLRETTKGLGEAGASVDIPEWAPIAAGIEQFKELLREADRTAVARGGQVAPELEQRIRSGFRPFITSINEAIGDDSGLPKTLRNELGSRLQREILPLVLLTQTAERFYSKPRGYAGDFMTIEMIYQDRPAGVGRLGAILDACFLDEPAAVAVKNRRPLLAREIQGVIEARAGDVAHVTSLACGPAQELFDVYQRMADPRLLQATLVDVDLQALAFVVDRRDRLALQRQMTPVVGNLVYMALGRQKVELQPQDLMYSIGLIDYFEDKFVIKLLDFIHRSLRPGGKVILGNFHPRNSSKALMDHVLDWRLIHRTEADMNRLFAASAFQRPCTRIVFEDQGVNLFAECVKA